MSEAPAISPAIVLGEVTRLIEGGRLDEAVTRAREALERGLEAPLLLNLRAYWLDGQNRPGEALRDLERAAALAPTDPAVLNALGLSLARLGRLEEALARFRACATVAPDFAPAHFNSGWAHEELGELDLAQEAFGKARKLMPGSADPAARLAALAARRGRWDVARAHAADALALVPGHPAASLALANADIAAGNLAAAQSRLEALLAAPALPAQDRATATGLLGDLLDSEGRYGEAFAAYSDGNALFEKTFAPKLALGREMPISEYAGWLLESLGSLPDWPAAEGVPPDHGPRRHLFVLGFPRSGTTLLEEVLACHPDVVTTGEKDALAPIVRELLPGTGTLDRLRTLDVREIAHFRARYFRGLAELGCIAENRILVDKQPFNTVRLPLIARLFPEARIVFCRRDPRDVVLSCFRRRFAANAANFEFLTLEGTARVYDTVMRLADLCRARLPLACHDVRNEDLVNDFEGEMRRLCRFAGIEWVDEFRDFAGRSDTREVATPSAPQIRRGLGPEGIGHWRNYSAQMAPVLSRLDAWAARLGYDAQSTP